MEWCNSRPNCKGFNTNGWMKRAILPESKLSTWTTNADEGLYVKVTDGAESALTGGNQRKSEESGECEDRVLPGTWGVSGLYTCDTYTVAYCDHVQIKRNCCMCQ